MERLHTNDRLAAVAMASMVPPPSDCATASKRWLLVDRLAEHIEHPAEQRLAHRPRNGAAPCS